MKRIELLAGRVKFIVVATLTLVMFLMLGLGLSGGAFAASDYDGDGATDNDCMPYDSAVAPGRPDKPDLQFEDTNCDGIDGDKSRAVFVATSGSNTSPGTMDQPKQTIQAAISTAAASGKDVYITGGNYFESVSLADNVGLYGGYTLPSGARSTSEVTVINGSPQAVLADGDEGIVLQQLVLVARPTYNGWSPDEGTAPSVYGVRAINNSALALERAWVRTSPASDGFDGFAYNPPPQAGDGGNGRQIRNSDGTPDCYNGGGRGGVGRGSYGLVGALQLNNSGGFGGRGGDAGSNGSAGDNGGGGSLGGRGGDGGLTSNDFGDFLHGKDGDDGAPGAPGSDGSNANFTTNSAGTVWVGGTATRGAQGDTGGGGGGGGGGAGRAVGWIPPFGDPVYWVSGGGGGSGGSSGWGGLGGTEGISGGGSFGIYLWNSTVAANASTILSENGGKGGNGGQGAEGGAGGQGGTGADAPSEECLLTGGNGGDGGDGGKGGDGGDGGAGSGGPSASIFSGGSSVYALRNSTTQFGAAGAGGLHGNGVSQAQSGVAAAALPTGSTPSTSSDFDRDGVPDADDACLSTPGTGADGCGADTSAPEVSLTSGPDNGSIITLRAADFSFGANETTSFFCKLDDAASFEPCSSPQRYTGLADGEHTFSVKAKDAAGNESAPLERTWTVDATPPEITVPADIISEATGSDGATVEYDASANDLISGSITPRCAPASGSTFGFGTTTVECSAEDAAGNNASATFDVTVRDTTPPEIIVPPDITQRATSSSGAVVNYDPAPTASDTVDGDLGSDKVSCEPPLGSTFPLGTTTVTCTATDSHDNTGTGTFEVDVVYGFGSGSFGEPVRDTELNRLAAGAAVPVKFGLGGDYGLSIFAAGYPTSKQIDCSTGLPPDDVEVTYTVSKSGLTYDGASGLYTYVWKTDRAWKGTCRELNLKLADGSNHAVQFRFT